MKNEVRGDRGNNAYQPNVKRMGQRSLGGEKKGKKKGGGERAGTRRGD